MRRRRALTVPPLALIVPPQSVERVKEAADIVEVDLRPHRPAPPGRALHRASARSTRSARRRSRSTRRRSSTTASAAGSGGDVIKFVEEKEGLGVRRRGRGARRPLRGRARARDGGPAGRGAAPASARRLERAARAHRRLLRDLPCGTPPRRRRRASTWRRAGSGRRCCAEFGVGYAPSAWDTVLIRGQRAGFSVEELEAAGLILQEPEGARPLRPLPLADHVPDPRRAAGASLGFGARALRPTRSRSTSTRRRASSTARGARSTGSTGRGRRSRRAGRAVVVEGYTDVLALHQAGIEEAVAVMGTAITPEQVKLLSALRGGGRCWRSTPTAPGARRCCGRSGSRRQAAAAAGGGDAGGRGPGRHARRRRRGERDRVSRRDRGGRGPAGLPRPHAARRRRPRARRRGATGRSTRSSPVLAAMGDSITPRGADARGRRPPRRRPGAGRAAGRGGGQRAEAGGARRRRPRAAAEGEPPPRAPTQALNSRERRERALLAMCVRLPAEGREVLDRLTDEHFSRPVAARARVWLREHLDDPLAGLRRDDEELLAYVTDVMMRAERGARQRRGDGAQPARARASRSSTTRSRRPRPTAAAPRRSTCSAAARSSRSGSRGRSRSLGSVAESEHTFAFPSGRARDPQSMDRDRLEGWLQSGLSLTEIGELVGRDPSTVGLLVQEVRP